MPSRQGKMDWDKLRIFHAVAEAGSFTHAGDTLNLSQSAVSRQISNLEDSLNVPLFHRHARGLLLTEQGELLYQTVHDVFTKLAQVENKLSESKERAQGPLRVTTTIAFGSVWLTPKLREFNNLYPDIDLTLILDDHERDLSIREADIAVRFLPPKRPDLIQRHLLKTHHRVFASPEYLKTYGIPKKPEELHKHRLIIYGDDYKPPLENINWLVHAGLPDKQAHTPILRVNNIYGMYRAVQSGLGIAALPDYFQPEQNNLVEILPELEGPPVDLFFIYPEELRNSKRVTVFREFLLRKLSQNNF